jgi:hypothetical protein
MAKVRSDRVKEVSLSQGTGNLALSGTGTGFVTFGAVCNDGDTFDYAVTNPGTSQWETGVGNYDAENNSVIRTTVYASSNNGNKVNFSAGNKQVFITVNSASFEDFDKLKTNATALAIALGG